LTLLAGNINGLAGVVHVFSGHSKTQLVGGQVVADVHFAKFLDDSRTLKDQLRYAWQQKAEQDDVRFAFKSGGRRSRCMKAA
jgi:hypothetical protein